MNHSPRKTTKYFFDKYKNKSIQTIKNASDSDLFSHDFSNMVVNLIKKCMPILDKAQYKVDLVHDLITLLNSPSNMHIDGGAEVMECAIFKTPILGDIELFLFLTGGIHDNGAHGDIGYLMGMDVSVLICKIISKKKIINNQEVLKLVNNQAHRCYALVEDILQNFESEFNSFITDELTPFVATEVKVERQWREQKNEIGLDYFQAKISLNPFAMAE